MNSASPCIINGLLPNVYTYSNLGKLMVLVVNWEGNNNMWVISFSPWYHTLLGRWQPGPSTGAAVQLPGGADKRQFSLVCSCCFYLKLPSIRFLSRPLSHSGFCPRAAGNPTAVFTPWTRHLWNVTFKLLPGCHSQTCPDQPSSRLQQFIVLWCEDALMSCCWWWSADCSLSCRVIVKLLLLLYTLLSWLN